MRLKTPRIQDFRRGGYRFGRLAIRPATTEHPFERAQIVTAGDWTGPTQWNVSKDRRAVECVNAR